MRRETGDFIMHIIDTHCDTLLNCFKHGVSLYDNSGHISLKKLCRGGAAAQFFAVFMSRNEMKNIDPYDFFNGVYAVYEKELAANRKLLLPAYCAEDVRKNQAENKISAVLTIEDGVVLGEDIRRLETLFCKGVRLITLTWNYENSIGFPCSSDASAHRLGLKAFGMEVVSRMNELGMLVDVSHLSEGGFYDVARLSAKPFIASHSCARALSSHQRNLTDAQLRVIGETGSVVGVNFCAEFLQEGAVYTPIENIVKHVVYMADKAGIESVGLGSDFDGIDDELEMDDYTGYPRLLSALGRHFTPSELDKICFENVLRLMDDSMKR